MLALIWRRDRVRDARPVTSSAMASRRIFSAATRTVAAVALVIVLGSLLHWAICGYAGFHGDEARAPCCAATATIQGYEDVLFLHKKEPARDFAALPAGSPGGTLTEALAPLPFTLAGITALLAVYLLGRRMFGPLAGWAAAMLLAVDGYAVAFARIVQYQSVVILTTAVVAILYRLLRRPQAVGSLSLYAALATTSCWRTMRLSTCLCRGRSCWRCCCAVTDPARRPGAQRCGAGALGLALTAHSMRPMCGIRSWAYVCLSGPAARGRRGPALQQLGRLQTARRSITRPTMSSFDRVGRVDVGCCVPPRRAAGAMLQLRRSSSAWRWLCGGPPG